MQIFRFLFGTLLTLWVASGLIFSLYKAFTSKTAHIAGGQVEYKNKPKMFILTIIVQILLIALLSYSWINFILVKV